MHDSLTHRTHACRAGGSRSLRGTLGHVCLSHVVLVMFVLCCLSGLIGPPRPKVGQVRTVAPGGGAAGGRWAGADIQRPTCKNMHAFACCARARTQLGKRRRESAKKVVAREARRSPRGSYICSGDSPPRVALRGRDGGRVRSGHGLAAGQRSRQRAAQLQHHRHGLGVCCSCCLWVLRTVFAAAMLWSMAFLGCSLWALRGTGWPWLRRLTTARWSRSCAPRTLYLRVSLWPENE